MRDISNRPEDQPLPEGGWSEESLALADACVVPPKVSALVQPAGVLYADGSYCPQAALWRRYRPITTQPETPPTVERSLNGRWLWGGVLWAHFGHFLVESTSRLWGLAHLKHEVRGVLFIPKRPASGSDIQGFHREFLSLIAPELRIHVAAEPTKVEELIVPGQGFGLGRITQGTRKYRNAIHSRFARDVRPDGPEKLYISRSALGLGKGGLLGEEKLEHYLEAEGYEVFHPQDHSMRDQIARYKAARHVIAADGSALHLFALVGRPDQKVAIIMRRESGASNLLADNVAGFCRRDPLVIDALRAEWVPQEKQRSSRLSFGELNHSIIGKELARHGFISGDGEWQSLSRAACRRLLETKGLGGEGGFVMAPKYRRKRKAVKQ
ncbi:hypothetical protein RSK20926_08727 [Roseobacter sp. SK209-2-6]|uniref:glycosyltransferase family 61 protein n=1 Tax=Roseobacter sp. SK209-2-6 TaxID=388739 RepID=UPI0000F3D15D|nr:glycosyltransferase family 61 protein [Roseobacter sp. SK209-2-6]EBA17041.1 hypothetical protein RSK20926_08727 [Roseobacter sp. SK209-2-6]